jgi:16S rRNA (cytosine967-C5)-methyltransferase
MVLKSGRQGKPDQPHQHSDKPGLDARLCAQRLLGAVIETATPLDGLTDPGHGHPRFKVLPDRDQSLVKAILTIASRRRNMIDALIAHCLDKPLPDNAKSLRHLLHVAVAQILWLDVPDHSAVDLAVDAARADPRNGRFASLVNAVLRRISREKTRMLAIFTGTVEEGPQWLRTALLNQYGPEKSAAILAAHQVDAPFDFTVKSEPERWAETLGGIALCNGTVRVARPDGPIPSLPGFAEGAWWVQDAAAALPAKLLGDVHGKRVLDLCAAPGGKTAQIAHAGAQVTAVELSASRLRRLESNLSRLGLSAQTWVGSAFDFKPDVLFDAVLLDAPCSSTGTIRRHPDVAWTKQPTDVTKLAKLQFELLAKAAQFVKPGGVLVFSNCSLLAEEGEDLVHRASRDLPGVVVSKIDPAELAGLEMLVTADGFLRSTPADLPMETPETSGMDGFFTARFSVG